MSSFASTASNRLGRAVGRQRIASFVGKCRHSRGYALAIGRDVPSSFANALTKYSNDEEPVDLANAKKQHEMYLQQLRTLVPTYCLPALDDHPDSIFVEDTVVAIGNRAVITNPGHPSRRGEVDTIKDVLVRLGMDVIDMRAENEDAICDGGDVLNAPRHLFVGLSERTNFAAVEVLANAFDVETVSVPFDNSNALHLTSIVCHMDSNTLLAPTGVVGDQALEAMRYNELGYDAIRLPNMLACNVVAVNGGILAQDGGCQESKALLLSAAAERGLSMHFVDGSEIAKVDGALTCCSVLLMGN